MTGDPWTVELLARTVFGEARSETAAGRLAVAFVALNRAADPRRRWPRSLPLVLLQPWAFSCWWQPGSNRDATLAIATDDPVLRACRGLATVALSDGLADPSGGANHYLSSALACSTPPTWYDPAKVTARIGRHEFLKL